MNIQYGRTAWLLVKWIMLSGVSLLAVAAPPEGMPKPWAAQWIARPDGPARDYDVVYFRKTVLLSKAPNKFLVDVSADTRFELHVNGKRVGAGPALADVHHWRYETFDLAPYLHTGENNIAAIVWNFGTAAATAQMSSQTAFLLSAEDPLNSFVNTGEGWLASQEPGRTLGEAHIRGYSAAGLSEAMDGNKMNWDWDKAGAGDSDQWSQAKPLGHAAPRGAQDSPTRWILERDELPAMQYTPLSAGHIVRLSGFPEGSTTLESPVTVPANSSATFLLDRDALVTAYPSIQLEGGKGASIDITYAEALYDAKGEKGNRNDVGERHIEGLRDHIVSDGKRRSYRTLWWRTWRYLQVNVKTTDSPLTIVGLNVFYTAYPFSAVAHFASDDPELSRIWDVGWRTAQLCAHETYMDTPYWDNYSTSAIRGFRH